MNYSDRYKKESFIRKTVFETYSGVAGWKCPSNIALIKYWGKNEDQLPMNPSLSFTLADSETNTTIRFDYDKSIKEPRLEFYFEGNREPLFESRISSYLKAIGAYLPFLSKTNLVIHSKNTFPHSAGIASSASSFAALALCLVSVENQLTGLNILPEDHKKKASFLARIGSGSASRSVYGKAALWGNMETIKGSSDEIAIPFESRIHHTYKSYHDVILIIDDAPKLVSSSKGHQLMEKNPFSQARFIQAGNNLKDLISILETADLVRFTEIIENEALSLHAMMLTSNPGFFLVKPATIKVIDKVRQYRDDTKIPLAFTLDAGPNVHLLFPAAYSGPVLKFITDELVQFCMNKRFIHDRMGDGPKQLEI